MSVLLISLAVGLLIAEIFIVSFGLLSLAGLALLIAAAYVLQVDPMMIWVFVGGIVVIFLAVGLLSLRARRKKPMSGSEILKGEVATVYDAIAPGKPGTIYMQGSYWPAYADQEIEAGSPVVIERMKSTHAYVRRVSN